MLTHMATFEKLLEDKIIIPVRVRLPRGQFYERKMFAFPECVEWMKSVKDMKTGRVQSDMTPLEQLTERLRQWLSGHPMVYGRMFHDMKPTTDNVWEMKTADLRVFGWMYRKSQFIAVNGGYADDYKEPTKIRNYADDRRAVVAARNAFPLDGEKLAVGDKNGLF